MLALARLGPSLRVLLMPIARNKIVLVVDDDEDNAAVLQLSLEGSGFEVRVASSVAEARAELASSSFDALVTDLSLGDGNALDLLASLGATRPRVAILVTGYGDDEARKRSRAAGFDAHIVKPVELVALERALTEGLASE